ncbi:MAG: bifunctional phosphoglucose/phosphomannose isomerase [Candidatus Solincola sediminis]|uniref:Bifunctional phosphoglucose/phosphomannose isomerase n=1 Tax=Candidatus Solincola sediminis TaxID=1797199 RepID=A0A1F2WHZ7_9ACTN|nr:MAG: bifunctional phosphoglucose/phosphomannose isomerase [Candidatus Solincola sediminis]OFW59829.1 MAG: bifunctional phosphoglucose/phosphomannose isomerase [Candidatus Solincola sediminis]
MPEISLDDVMQLEDSDPQGMLSMIESFPKQCLEALKLGTDMLDVPEASGIKKVAFIGMGGSGIGGQVLRALLEEPAGLSISVHRSYKLPSVLGPDTLAVVVSYSGNTEETLAALDDAVYLGCKIMAVTGGGQLLQKARDFRWPLITVPQGLQPRAALGYLSLPQAVAMEKMGLIQGFIKVAHECIDYLKDKKEEWGRMSPLNRNFAKQLATRLQDKIPVVYGTDGILAVAAYRWKCQFNENTEIPAFCNMIPEMDHNEIVGWHGLDEFTRKVELIFLVEEGQDTRMANRVEVTAELLQDRVGGVTMIHVGGNTPLDKLFSTMYLGDFVSTYLALLNGTDPVPVAIISELKERMAKVEPGR